MVCCFKVGWASLGEALLSCLHATRPLRRHDAVEVCRSLPRLGVVVSVVHGSVVLHMLIRAVINHVDAVVGRHRHLAVFLIVFLKDVVGVVALLEGVAVAKDVAELSLGVVLLLECVLNLARTHRNDTGLRSIWQLSCGGVFRLYLVNLVRSKLLPKEVPEESESDDTSDDSDDCTNDSGVSS